MKTKYNLPLYIKDKLDGLEQAQPN